MGNSPREFVEEMAEDECHYGDGCPSFAGTLHGRCDSCKARLALAEDDEAAARHEAACAWRPRPPTTAEMEAHHEAHSRGEGGPSYWIWGDEDGPWGLVMYHPCGATSAEMWTGDEWTRPADADGVACPWPTCGGQDTPPEAP